MNVALIFGCPRSGTSILGELVASHPNVKYLFEWAQWNPVSRSPNNSHRQIHAPQTTIDKVRKEFKQLQGNAKIIAEKNPRNVLRVPFLREIFPEAKLIHIVRDGRDVACSLVPGIGGATWMHAAPPSWQTLMKSEKGVVRCAHAWKDMMDIVLSDLEKVPETQFLQIHYENLVLAPVVTADKIFNFLDLPMVPRVRKFCANIQNETTGYQAQKQVRWTKINHKHRIGRWKINMTIHQQNIVNEILEPVLRRLRYV